MVNGILNSIENGEEVDFSAVNGLGDTELVDLMEGLGLMVANKSLPANVKQQAGAFMNKAVPRIIYKKPANPGYSDPNKRVANSQHTKGESKELSGKALFEARIDQIEDPRIKASLLAKTTTFMDHEIVVCKKAVAGITEMIKAGDARDVGYTNINKAQLPSGTAMLVTAISVEAGVHPGTPTGVEATDCKVVKYTQAGVLADAAIVNGEYDFKNGQKVLGDDVPVAIFTNPELDVPVGFHRLEVPKILQNATDIIFDIKPAGTPATNTYLKVRLRGVITVKA